MSSPHAIIGGEVVLFCSDACRARGRTVTPEGTESAPSSVGHPGRLLAIGLGIASISPCGSARPLHPIAVEYGMAQASDVAPADDHATPPEHDIQPEYGPRAPTEEERAVELVNALSRDTWLHPLAGPTRRMPARSSRVFGAARDGNRPDECRSGHCGVDLGGEIWGEAVFAVHDGIVDRVSRNPNGSGGMYVRLSHRDGAVFTQYFHLAAIPKHLHQGREVRAGDVIGLVGETGVDNSGPHLHFTVSVKPSADSSEIYMDPEPLVALWPVKIPDANGAVATALQPGAPLGATGYRKARRRRRPARSRGGVASKAPVAAADTEAGAGAPPAMDSVADVGDSAVQ